MWSHFVSSIPTRENSRFDHKSCNHYTAVHTINISLWPTNVIILYSYAIENNVILLFYHNGHYISFNLKFLKFKRLYYIQNHNILSINGIFWKVLFNRGTGRIHALGCRETMYFLMFSQCFCKRMKQSIFDNFVFPWNLRGSYVVLWINILFCSAMEIRKLKARSYQFISNPPYPIIHDCILLNYDNNCLIPFWHNNICNSILPQN